MNNILILDYFINNFVIKYFYR